MKHTRYLVQAAIIAALYAVLTHMQNLLLPGSATWAIQMRISEALCVLAFGTNRGVLKRQAFWLLFYVALYAAVYAAALDPLYGLLQMGVVLALPLLRQYNGQRGKSAAFNRFMKWFFYLYYPLHLLILGALVH